jgi:c-di-GMP-binding flagellar brake protein YcgR
LLFFDENVLNPLWGCGMGEEGPGVRIVRLVRRKYPRFLLTLPVEYSCLDSNISHPGRGENASEGGLKVYLLEQFKVGENLRMKLFFAFGPELQTIESTAQVVWADFRPEEEEGNRYGVKFLDISSENSEKWKSFLNSLNLQQSP